MGPIEISAETDRILPVSDLANGEAWAMVESSPDGMLLADENGELLLVNQQVEKMFGYDRGELLGSSVDTLLPDRFQGAHRAHRTRYRAAPSPRSMGTDLELWAKRKDGSEFPVEVSLSPLQVAGGTRVVATVRDVTERYEAEAESHAVMHTVNAARDGVFMFDPETLHFSYVNQGAVRQLGYTRQQLLEMTPLHIKPEFTESSFRAVLEPLLTDEVHSRVLTTVHRRKDGEDVPVEIVLEYPAAAANGRPRRMVAVVRDISERVLSDIALASSEEAFRTAFDSAPVGMAMVDFADPVRRPLTRVNTALCRLLGYTEKQLLTMGFAELTHPDDAQESDRKALEAVDGETPAYAVEKRYLRADGSPVWVWVHSAVLDDGSETPSSVLVHVADLTESRRAQEDQARLRRLEDRERLAEDLHDLIIQRLFAAGMSLQSLQSHISDDVAVRRLGRTVDELDHTISDLRNAIFRLHSPLEASIRHQIEETVHAANPALGFSPSLHIEGDPERIAGAVVEQLLPTITEALSNIAKHADATKASAVLTVGEMVELAIVDNGCGIDPSAAQGHGIRNMQSRAERVGGNADVSALADGGTQLTWSASNR